MHVVVFLALALSGWQDRPEVAEVLREGARLVAAGRLAAAEELYEKTRAAFPDDPELTFELGMVYFQLHKWERAAENYRESLRVKPGSVKPLFYLAEVYYMEGNKERARETIQQAAAIAPNDAQVCQKYGEYLSLDPAFRSEGLLWLQKARRLSASLKRIDFAIGMVQFELGDYAAAAGSLEAAVRTNSGEGQAAFLLAESLAKLNEWEKARKYYEVALAQGWVNGGAYYGLGAALVELKEFGAAIPALERALALQPSMAAAHFQLSRVYRQSGKTGQARHETRLFMTIAHRVDAARELKGPEEEGAWKRVKPLVEANREQEALAVLGSNRGDAHYLLGVIYYGLGRKDDALRLLKIARQELPDSARVAAYLGLVQLYSGDTAAAEESFRSALEMNSTEFLALTGTGGIRYQQKRWAEAAEYFERSRTGDAGTLYLLCDAYFRLNRTEDAMLTAEAVRALGFENKALLGSLEELVKRHAAADVEPRRHK
jgi:tetratricopeptide (TPR) repeat protein